MDRIRSGFHFPTSLAFDGDGVAYVAESGFPFDDAPPGGRVLRLLDDGTTTLVASGLRPPVNGLTWHDGVFYVAEGGNPREPGRISRLTPGGELTTVLDDLPSGGNYHTNMAAVDGDGWLYFGVGAATNSGFVGYDGRQLAWLRRLRHNWDVPGYEVELRGVNLETPSPEGNGTVTTGAFQPFGTPSHAGQRIPASVPATASVMRCRVDGSGLELVAWGLRNAYGLAFDAAGRLLATDQAADERGSRPLGGAPDLLVEVRAGAWYGWPDFVGGVPVTDPRFSPSKGPSPEFVLANHDELPPPEPALVEFPSNACATKLDFGPPGSPLEGVLFVALFGDEKPLTAPAGEPSGRELAWIDEGLTLHSFGGGSFARPIDVRFDPAGEALWVLDFGEFEMTADDAVEARAGSGSLTKIPLAELQELVAS